MKTHAVILLLVAQPLVTFLALDSAIAEDQTPPPAVRKSFAEERPDSSRGWVIVTKRSYWPLCYEALDRLEEANRGIGSADPAELADQLQKCGAWMQLAADAAMTENQAGISDTANYFEQAAESLRTGSGDLSETQLRDLIVLGNLSMAKSHLLRAVLMDQRQTNADPKTRKDVSAEVSASVKSSEREIRAERLARNLEQYRYDSTETRKHLDVAMTYLQAAKKLGGFEFSAEVLADLPAFDFAAPGAEIADYVADTLRPRIGDLKTALEPVYSDYQKRFKSLQE